MISKNDVPSFTPKINSPFIYKKDENLKKFLLTKLVNAEYASLKAPAFSQFSEKTLEHALSKLYDELYNMNFSFTWLGDALTYAQTYNSNVNMIHAVLPKIFIPHTPPNRSGSLYNETSASYNDSHLNISNTPKELKDNSSIASSSSSKFSFKNPPWKWRRSSYQANTGSQLQLTDRERHGFTAQDENDSVS